jgi:hypothetical protein
VAFSHSAILRAEVVSRAQARELALALPEAVEQDHHGRPPFRVAGKIFATQWDEEHMNVMLDEDGIRTALHEHPSVCEEVWWGKKLTAVRVDLRHVDRNARRSVVRIHDRPLRSNCPRCVAPRTSGRGLGKPGGFPKRKAGV